LIQLSVIIVGFKNYQIVCDCLDSIGEHNDIGPQLEVILVDNSPDHEVYKAVIEKYLTVIAVKNKNKGFGAGNNVGAALAKGKYLLFLNPDTVLVEPVFKFALNRFESDEKLGMFGVRLVSETLSRNASFYLCNGGGLLRSIFIKFCNRFDLYIDGYMYIAGADMFVRHEDFNLCGRFDENIFMYYEEPDLTYRIRSIGRTTAYFGNKKIIHLEGGATPGSEFALRRRLESAIYYYKKYGVDVVDVFRRELRLNYLKLFVYRAFGFGSVDFLGRTIQLLKEFIRRIESGR